MQGEQLWTLGQPWADLTQQIRDAGGQATLLQQSGTIHLLDRGRRARVSGRHPLPGDASWVLVETQLITTCGSVWFDLHGTWHASSAPAAIFLGHPVEDRELARDLIDAEYGVIRERLETLSEEQRREITEAVPEGHPEEKCGALWCPAAPSDERGTTRAIAREPLWTHGDVDALVDQLNSNLQEDKVQEARRGERQFKNLSPVERARAHKLVDEDVQRGAADAKFGTPESD